MSLQRWRDMSPLMAGGVARPGCTPSGPPRSAAPLSSGAPTAPTAGDDPCPPLARQTRLMLLHETRPTRRHETLHTRRPRNFHMQCANQSSRRHISATTASCAAIVDSKSIYENSILRCCKGNDTIRKSLSVAAGNVFSYIWYTLSSKCQLLVVLIV